MYVMSSFLSDVCAWPGHRMKKSKPPPKCFASDPVKPLNQIQGKKLPFACSSHSSVHLLFDTQTLNYIKYASDTDLSTH